MSEATSDPILTTLARLESAVSRVEAEQERLRLQLNGKMDDILDKLSANRQDIDTTRGHVLYGLQDSLTLSQRITKLEDKMRRR